MTIVHNPISDTGESLTSGTLRLHASHQIRDPGSGIPWDPMDTGIPWDPGISSVYTRYAVHYIIIYAHACMHVYDIPAGMTYRGEKFDLISLIKSPFG